MKSLNNTQTPSQSSMAKPTITVIGSLNTDLTTLTTRLPSAGETLLSRSFSTNSGGKGANQAVACARLSRPNITSPVDITVRMVGAVGDDTFGQDLLNDLRSNSIETTDVVVREGERSGVAVIIVEESTGENRILMSPNANFSLKPSGFERLSDPVPDLLVLQLEIALDTTLQILRAVKEKGVEVLLNPAPAQKLPEEAWSAVTHLIVNESEAAIITGYPAEQSPWLQFGEHTKRILALGVRHTVITLGAQGVIYLDPKLQVLLHYSAKDVNVVDTTAAGDTFVGAYAVAVVRHKEKVPLAVNWANEAASKTVERRGAQMAIPWGEEVEAFENMTNEGERFLEWS